MAESIFADLASRILSVAEPDPAGGFDRSLWATVETAGLDKLLLPEDLGGAGDAYEDAVAVMIAFGRAGAALPLADTLVANWCLSKAGQDVPGGPKAYLCEPDLRREASGWTGVAYWQPVTSSAVLLTEAGDAVSLVMIDELAGTPGESAAGEPLLWLRDGASLGVASGRRVDLVPGQALAVAATLEAAAIVGALEKICTLSIDYANTRRQFGKAISKFQAVQGLVARLASETAAARAAVEHAATVLATPHAPFWAGVAKSRASEAAGKGAALAHQIHGAIGFTREYELHRHTRRLWTWRERRGNELYWNERIGSAALADGGNFWAGLVDGLTL